MGTVTTHFESTEKFIKFLVVGIIGLVVAAFGTISVTGALPGGGYGYGAPTQSSPQPVLRSYKQSIGDHLYTISAHENGVATSSGGYNSEGTAFNGYTGEGPSNSGLSSVYRSWNQAKGDHFYTTDFGEYINSQNFGYSLEGVGFHNFKTIGDAPGTGPGGTTGTFVNPVYRLYNNGTSDHFYTLSIAERDAAAAGGYTNEGTAFYAPQ